MRKEKKSETIYEDQNLKGKNLRDYIVVPNSHLQEKIVHDLKESAGTENISPMVAIATNSRN